LRQWQVHHLDKIEARVLTGLKERLVSSEAVAEAVRAYAEEMNRLNRDRRVQATTDQKALAQIEKAIAGIIAAIEDGMYQPSMKARMDDLERQKAEIVARLTEAPVDMPDVHPNRANLYRLRVERLTDALSDPDGGRQAAEALRSLIGEIVLTPGAKRGEVHPTLRGELFGILDFAKVEETGRPAGFMPAVEASPRNQLNLLNQVIRPVLQAVFLFAARHDKAVSSAALKGVLVRPQPRSASRSFCCTGGSDAACARLDPKEWHRLENGALSRRHGREKLEIDRLRRLHARLNTRERASLKEAGEGKDSYAPDLRNDVYDNGDDDGGPPRHGPHRQRVMVTGGASRLGL
jgi:hypothetical protein